MRSGQKDVALEIRATKVGVKVNSKYSEFAGKIVAQWSHRLTIKLAASALMPIANTTQHNTAQHIKLALVSSQSRAHENVGALMQRLI